MLVFQYGSNCDSNRLNSPKRLRGFAHDLGKAQTMDDWKIAFDVYSHRNRCAAGDLVPAPGAGKAWGVLYEVPAELVRGMRVDGPKTLEQIEGNKYEEKAIRVENSAGTEVDAITFVVKPAEQRIGLWTSAEYVGHIVKGLRQHEVPTEYVMRVIEIALETNRRAERRAKEESREIESLLL